MNEFRNTVSPAFCAAIVLISFCATTYAAEPTKKDWPLGRHDPQSSGFTDEKLPTDLSVIWEYKCDEAIEASPVVTDGKVFVADVFGKLYCVNESDGKEIWKKNYDTGFAASPSIRNKRLFIGDVEGNLYGIDTETGKEIWKQETGGTISGSIAFYKNDVLATSQDGKLHCFTADGKPKWAYATEDQVQCSPTVAGERTFLGGCDGQLHIVDLNTGKAAKDPLPLGGPTGSTPAVSGDKAFLPIMDGAVLAFDWKKSKELWRHLDEDRPQEYRCSAAVTKDLVIVSSQFKQVDAISIETGKRKWRYTLKRRADASPVIAGDDVWIAATDGRLIRLGLNDGKEKWKFEIRGSFIASPAIANGRLYIPDEDGVLRCFGKKK